MEKLCKGANMCRYSETTNGLLAGLPKISMSFAITVGIMI